jgi:hypothetical protein
MKQHEAVIKVMEGNGGYATLGFLNQNVLKIEDCEWKTKTPFASIRRIVQDKRHFFKIRPGLWALNTFKDKLPSNIFPAKSEPKAKQEEYTHTFYQGLLVELGNFKAYKTCVANQDKNKLYLGKKLSELTTTSDEYQFSYDHLIQIVHRIDVTWFNERKMPGSFFEVEHSKISSESLLKFTKLQNFHSDFCIVADVVRRRELEAKLSLQAFKPVRERVVFWSYDYVAELHSKTAELVAIEQECASKYRRGNG